MINPPTLWQRLCIPELSQFFRSAIFPSESGEVKDIHDQPREIEELVTSSPRMRMILECARNEPQTIVNEKIFKSERAPRMATHHNAFEVSPVDCPDDVGVFCIAGLGGFGHRLQSRAAQIALDNNVRVRVHALPGHNGDPAELVNMSFSDGVRSILKYAENWIVKHAFKSMVIIGHSTGGLYALMVHSLYNKLHSGEKLFDCAVLTGPPLSYYDKASEAEVRKRYNQHARLMWDYSGLTQSLLHKLRSYEVPNSRPDENSSKLERGTPHMTKFPLNSLFMLEDARLAALRVLSTIDIPVHHRHGREDRVAHPEESFSLFKELTKKNRQCTSEFYDKGHSGMWEEKRQCNKKGPGSAFLNDMKKIIAELRTQKR